MGRKLKALKSIVRDVAGSIDAKTATEYASLYVEWDDPTADPMSRQRGERWQELNRTLPRAALDELQGRLR